MKSMSRHTGYRSEHGFTMPELIVTMVIMAILAVVAMPSLISFEQDIRAKEAAANLMEAFMRARSQAVVLNTTVTVNPAASGWGSGWTLVTSNGQKVLSQNITSVNITGSVGSVTYTSAGRVSGATASATFQVQSQSANPGPSGEWCVSINPSGRPYMANGAC